MSVPSEYNPRFTANLPKVSMVYPDSSYKDSYPTTGTKEQSRLLTNAGASVLPTVTSASSSKRSVFA